MIFHRIVVTNLFSYLGEQTYDFTSDGPGSVAVVIGRNGYGKTSLLNAVKLLFLGTEDKSQRRMGFPPRYLSRNEYVYGVERGWAGIRNRHAQSPHCSVRAELGDRERITFTATRSWNFDVKPVQETLVVEEAGKDAVKNAAAEVRLGNLIPRELVPYFFFDGEEVQFLAEADNKARAEAMERLLSLSFINGVSAQLTEVVKSWSREALPRDVQVEIRAEEGRLASLQSEIMTQEHRRSDLQRQSAELAERQDALRRSMDGLRTGGGIADSRQLEDEVAGLKAALEAEFDDLATALATDAPLLANPGLVAVAHAAVTKVVEAKTQAANSVADTLHKVLPQRLLVEPPQPREPLSEGQRAFLEAKLRGILESYAVTDTGPAPLLDSLDLKQARSLLHSLNRFNAAMPALRQERARRLKEATAQRARLDRLRAELRDSQTGSGERAEEYRRLEQERDDVGRALGKLESELERLEHKLAAKAAEEKEIAARLNGLERRHHLAGVAEGRLSIAQKLRETFADYRKRTRANRRAEIENAVNRHFQRLMTGHRMIAHIRIDEDFVMHFVDADQVEFGQLTVSHGMRQLAVTALLWALKDVSGRVLPIIVDTPLARIDRDNQMNLLQHYYPLAAEQVIILATDSEIDEAKFKVLEPHVGVRFRLENPDGQSTRVIRLRPDGEGA
jgi:DNA sulfur modification protein DndD